MLNRLRLQFGVALIGFVAIALTILYFTTSVHRTSVPVRGGTYVEGVVPDGFRQGDAPALTLNPILAPSGVSQDIASLLFRGLTRANAKGAITPDIADHWDYADNNTVMEFHLRHDVRWQDGEPVTSRDVVFTVNVLKDPNYAAFNPKGAGFASVFNNVTVTALGDYSVRFTLADAWTPFLNYTSFGLLPAHLLAAHPDIRDIAQSNFNTRPIGNGYFRLLIPDAPASGLPPAAITADGVALVASDSNTDTDPTSPQPNLDKIWFRFFPTSKAALTALQAGEIDGVGYVPPSDVADLTKGAGDTPTADTGTTPDAGINRIVTFTVPQTGYDTLFFNLRGDSVFGKKEVRQAIAAAVDRARIISACQYGQAAPTYTPILPISWAYDKTATPPALTIAAANKLLDSAGWQTGQDGVRIQPATGQVLSFGITTDGSGQRPCVADTIAAQLRQIGIVATPRIVAAQQLNDSVTSRNYEALIAAPLGVYNDPDVYQSWHSSQADKGYNLSGWKNDAADRLIEDARQNGDQGQRQIDYGKWQHLFLDEMPSLPLYYSTYTYALSSRIGGVSPGALAFMNTNADRFKDILQRYVLTATKYGN